MKRLQRWTPGGIRTRLDRRFARRERVASLENEVSELGRTVAALGLRLDKTLDTLAETVATSEARYDELVGRLQAVASDADANIASTHVILDSLAERLSEVDERSRRGADFVRDEDPHELRKKLFYSHQLASQAGEAIESLLQAELSLWQAIDQLAVESQDEHGTWLQPSAQIEDE